MIFASSSYAISPKYEYKTLEIMHLNSSHTPNVQTSV